MFSDDEQKANFSSLFTEIESDAHFDFLRSFRRVRVIFRSAKSATAAKLLTQHLSFNGTTLKAFFAQVSCIISCTANVYLILAQLLRFYSVRAW